MLKIITRLFPFYFLALFVMALDQANKLFFIYSLGIKEGYRLPLLPFFDIVMVWNKGISYGLFQQEGPFGSYLLFGAKFVIAIGLIYWMHIETKKYALIGLSLILGGALGNMIDRVHFGAVADFYLFHWQNFQWYVFNVADVAIVFGVALLIYEEVVKKPNDKGSSRNA